MIDPLLESVLKAGALTAFVGLGIALFKNQTDRAANRIAEKRMLLEVDADDRKADEERRKADAERREELRKDIDREIKRADANETRAETEKKRADGLETELRNERRTFDLRMVQCARVGSPCEHVPLEETPKETP